jgi:hypothetical protein
MSHMLEIGVGCRLHVYSVTDNRTSVCLAAHGMWITLELWKTLSFNEAREKWGPRVWHIACRGTKLKVGSCNV